MNRVLDIWWDGRLVGRLRQPRPAALEFAYAEDWLRDDRAPALSASLPKRAEQYSRRECRPFFAGLLPEETQRDRVARSLGVSPLNDFALLDRLGGDVAGALQLLPPGESPTDLESGYSPQPLDDAALIEVLDRLPWRPLLAGEAGLRLSLAGAQSKLPVVTVDGRIAPPAPGQPTTHILKPAIPDFPHTTENEAFAMRLARSVGLDVASVEPRRVGDRTFLLVARYDRSTGTDGRVRRVHQEDFCQALGIPPEAKYAGEGGPGLRDGFGLLRQVALRPAVDVLRLLDATIFNLIIGNADAHGKNFSLLYDAAGPRLAPLYDLVMTTEYPELSRALAMPIGGCARLAEMDSHRWKAFAQEMTLGLPLIRRRVAELGESVIRKAQDVAQELTVPGLDVEALSRFGDMVVGRAEQCMASTAPEADRVSGSPTGS
ncbi:type II toxin-antitoxin system HipA family toxin [Candidatus Palauibacter polyketidifaciens]|uniref:type II toxin-antitoxin system HipA family toxin n=1 Tax=Candidatus Palauibacter polyketidifaciens TaxID=3056740 RepID=UPI00139B3BE5|nr:type II toxin-antitoxin system HipA family toxin [Candidatus Palauibacter polyketidifaciens]MDE2720035.1 type II toxin-antitoxin system HipA family toxin [Candidatus Palauibacter polyketidifaciens]MYE34025.1 type II toxin-antitoxin system HipA family toxin [Gemmatimonadales bacterium]